MSRSAGLRMRRYRLAYPLLGPVAPTRANSRTVPWPCTRDAGPRHRCSRTAAPHGPSSTRSNLSSARHHHSTPGGGPTATPPVRASTPLAGRWHQLPAGPRPPLLVDRSAPLHPIRSSSRNMLRDPSTNARPASRTDPASLANPASPPHRVTSQISPMSGTLSLHTSLHPALPVALRRLMGKRI